MDILEHLRKTSIAKRRESLMQRRDSLMQRRESLMQRRDSYASRRSSNPSRGDNDSPTSGSHPARRESDGTSPIKAEWELGWQESDTMLQISTFNEKKATPKRKGASASIRQKILKLEESMYLSKVKQRRRRVPSGKKTGKFLGIFRSLANTVILLLKCFKMRVTIFVQADNLTYTDYVKRLDLATRERISLSIEMQMIFSTPPELRKEKDLKKVAFYLRANGASRAMLGHTSLKDDLNLARYISYERYESGRVVARQGRNLDRFYYVVSGKLLMIQEYHVANSVISKTTSVLTKGHTTNVEEMTNETTRQQTLVCSGSVEAFVIDREEYFALCRDRSGGAKEYLATHQFFRLFPSNLLENDSKTLQLRYYPNGTSVFSGGRPYDWIYIVKSGECSLVRTQYVNNVHSQKKTIFSKQNPQELGCDRSVLKVCETLAEFRAWRKKTAPLSKRKPPVLTDLNSVEQTKLTVPEKNIQVFKLAKSEKNVHNQSFEDFKSNTLPLMNNKTFQENAIKPQNRVYSGLDPIEASMAGINISSKQVLSKSRMSAKTSQVFSEVSSLTKENRITKSAPPVLRRAHLELGKLKQGDVFGLDDLYGADEDVMRIALLSNGADVIKMKRGFFLRNAPTDLLMQLSGMNHDYPSVNEAKVSLEASETWNMYKQALIDVLTSGRKSRQDETSWQLSIKVKKPKTASTPELRHSSQANSTFGRSRFSTPASSRHLESRRSTNTREYPASAPVSRMQMLKHPRHSKLIA